jgi:two-component system cell cycle response regulator
MPGSILIAEPVSAQRILVRARLASRAYRVTQETCSAAIRRRLREDPPDLLWLPERLQDGCGIALCRALRADPATWQVPVLLRLDDGGRAARLRALAAGADAVPAAAEAAPLLNARIRNLVRRQAVDRDLVLAAEAERLGALAGHATPPPRPGRLALILPAGVDGTAWQRALHPRLRGRVELLGARRALAALSQRPAPEALLVAEDPADPLATLQLVSDLRSRGDTMRAALLLVQSAPCTDRAVQALDLGVDDLAAGFDPEEIALRLRREMARKARADRLRAALRDGLRLALTDPLTGLANRRAAMARLQDIARDPGGAGFAVLALDVDRFKRINDRHGHAAGDLVLAEIARRMAACLRREDLLARIGGEEFLAVLPGCGLGRASSVADRLRRAVCERPVPLPGAAGGVRVTVSVGLTTGGTPPRRDAARLLEEADRALYGAKTAGRNRVTLSPLAA